MLIIYIKSERAALLRWHNMSSDPVSGLPSAWQEEEHSMMFRGTGASALQDSLRWMPDNTLLYKTICDGYHDSTTGKIVYTGLPKPSEWQWSEETTLSEAEKQFWKTDVITCG